MYYAIINVICANKLHCLGRAGAMGGKFRQTNTILIVKMQTHNSLSL